MSQNLCWIKLALQDNFPITYILKIHCGGLCGSTWTNMAFLKILVFLLKKSVKALPLIKIIGRPDLLRSFMLSMVSSYCIGMSEARRCDLYASVSIFPKTIHLRIATFLMPNPGLSIHLFGLLLGINSVDKKKSTI